MTFYRRKLPHLQRDYKWHFITFCTYQRWILPERARDIVMDCCLHDHDKTMLLAAAVVMPDHVHLILCPLIDQAKQEIWTLAAIMQAIKGASAHQINRALGRTGRVWQTESFDHVVRCAEGMDQKVSYLLDNPVRKRLVAKWSDYRWVWWRVEQEGLVFSPIQVHT
jgi:REP element-mobilizing transposase RayT